MRRREFLILTGAAACLAALPVPALSSVLSDERKALQQFLACLPDWCAGAFPRCRITASHGAMPLAKELARHFTTADLASQVEILPRRHAELELYGTGVKGRCHARLKAGELRLLLYPNTMEGGCESRSMQIAAP